MDTEQDVEGNLDDTQALEAVAEPPAAVPTIPPPNYEAMTAAAVRAGIEAAQSRSVAVTPREPEEDPVNLWTFDEKLSPKEQARMFHQNIEKAIQKRTAPLEHALRDAYGRLALVEKTKAADPEVARLQGAALELLRSGAVNDPDIAFELAKARDKGAKPGGVQTPNGPRATTSKPVPPASTAPVRTAAPSNQPKKRPRGLLDMWGEYQSLKKKG